MDGRELEQLWANRRQQRDNIVVFLEAFELLQCRQVLLSEIISRLEHASWTVTFLEIILTSTCQILNGIFEALSESICYRKRTKWQKEICAYVQAQQTSKMGCLIVKWVGTQTRSSNPSLSWRYWSWSSDRYIYLFLSTFKRRSSSTWTGRIALLRGC